MRNHLLRPFWVALGAVACVLLLRLLLLPPDFGIHGANFTYGFYRLASIDDWMAFPVKYRGRQGCQACHPDNSTTVSASPHRVIQCENCHGPAREHPDDPAALEIDDSRALCLRCHAELPYPDNPRAAIPAIDPGKHNPASLCVVCHNPHQPSLEDM